MNWVVADEVEEMSDRAYLYIVNSDTFALLDGLKKIQPADFREDFREVFREACWL